MVALGGGFNVVASTGLPGFALQNGTPTIFTWTAPNDGKPHPFLLTGIQDVTSAETGGGVNVNYTIKGQAATLFPWGAGFGVGISAPAGGALVGVADPGTTVSLVQAGALTVGAAVIVADLVAI